MSAAGLDEFAGPHDEPTKIVRLLYFLRLAVPEVMDVGNDPRFFTGNIINKRLAAFGSLSVISGLLVQNAMTELFSMNKQMEAYSFEQGQWSWEGICQTLSFVLLIFVLFGMLLATLVGVEQPYHGYRLMTLGPNGFDAAASYYLNPNVVAWRHISIKWMLACLPTYLLQMGLRLNVKFDRTTKKEPDLPKEVPKYARGASIFFCIVFVIYACILQYINWKHWQIYRERYLKICGKGRDLTRYYHRMAFPTTWRNMHEHHGYSV